MDEYEAEAADIGTAVEGVQVRELLKDQRRTADQSFSRNRRNSVMIILGASVFGLMGATALLYLHYQSGGVLAGAAATSMFVLSTISTVLAVLTMLAGFVALFQLREARQMDLRRLDTLDRQLQPRLTPVAIRRHDRGLN